MSASSAFIYNTFGCYGEIQFFTFGKAKERNRAFIVHGLFYIRERCHTKKELYKSDVLMTVVNNTFIFSFGLVAKYSLNHREPETPVSKQRCCRGQVDDFKLIDGLEAWMMNIPVCYYNISFYYGYTWFIYFFIHHHRKHLPFL